MSQRRPTGWAIGAALAFLVLAAIPLAAADHAYSHRYVVYGRVLDAENNPVPGLTVDLGYEAPFTAEGPCADQPGTETQAFGRTRTSPVTNALGEFMFCFHTHSMSRAEPGAGILSIPTLEVEQRFEFDAFMRYSFVPIKLDTVQSTANKTALNEFYTIQGRAWRPAGGPVTVEGIRVYGETIDNVPVNLTLEYNGKAPVTVSTLTNSYGDFAIRVPIEERAASGRVTMLIENQTFTAALDPEVGTTQFRAEFERIRDPFISKFLVGLGVVAAVVVGGGALWYGSNRVKTSRDDRLAREQSGRKRSNK